MANTATDEELAPGLKVGDRVTGGPNGRQWHGELLEVAGGDMVRVEREDGSGTVTVSLKALDWSGKPSDTLPVRKRAKQCPKPAPATRDETDRQAHEADSERLDRLMELWDTPTSWQPVGGERLRKISEGTHKRTEPTVWRREDGQPLLYPRRVNLCMGEPETCKTWMALAVIAEEIRAGNAGMLIDLEDSDETAVERLIALGLSADDLATRFAYVQPSEPFGEVAAAHLDLCRQMLDGPLTVTVVDSMTEGMALEGLDPYQSTDVSKFYGRLPQYLADSGAAVTVLDHVTNVSSGVIDHTSLPPV